MKLRTTIAAGGLAVATLGAGLVGASSADAGGGATSFALQRSPGIVKAGCLPNAAARVTVKHDGEVEKMRVDAWGLPPNTEFDTFIIQVPNFPFGVSWYQGDLESNRAGVAHVEYVGRFQQETFAIAPNTAPAPSVHSSPTPDAASNPPFGPIHTFHVGVWFNSPEDAAKAGCPSNTTPFNGEHNAGVQVLNTAQFPDTAGPLGAFKP
jgi:hypothetical protein